MSFIVAIVKSGLFYRESLTLMVYWKAINFSLTFCCPMAKPVTIYSTQTCAYCKATKEFLNEQSIEFTDIDVGNDQEKAREMIQKSGQMGVPVIVVGEGDEEQLIVGFDKAKLSEALGIEG